MSCPKCRSEYLMIKQKRGFERFRIYFTGLREYLCRNCDTTFRAPDRRRIPRDEKMGAGLVLTPPRA